MPRMGGVVLGLALVAAACGGADSGHVAVTLDDFTIELTPAQAERGEIAFDIRNEGALEHELVILRTDLPEDELPSEEGVVSVTGPIELVDEVKGIGPEAEESLAVDLEPASYLMICNIAGHYDQGMRAAFRVT